MAERSIMEALKVQLKLILFTTSAVILLGLFSVSSWYINSTAVAKASSKRQPANFGQPTKVETSSGDKIPKMAILKLGCLPKDSSTALLQSTARQVRIVGSLCHSPKHKLTKSSILNSSNGFEGTTFHLSGSQFTSDFLYLKTGLNKIQFNYSLSSGKSHYTEINIFNARGVAFTQ